MIILDFYGMPGSGKSTISHLLAERLRKDGYTVVEPSWTLDNKRFVTTRILKKLFLTLEYAFKHPCIMNSIIRYVNDSSNSFKQKIKLCINFAYTMNYETRHEDVDIMIMDEGIAQAVVSLVTESTSSTCNQYLIYLLSKVNEKIKLVYCKVPLMTAMERLKERGTKKSRVDMLVDREKIEMLEHIEYLCENLSKDSIEINNVFSLDSSTSEDIYHGLVKKYILSCSEI